jgi:hypothetical protein
MHLHERAKVCRTTAGSYQAKELPLCYPLRRHIKARNPVLNCQRLQEGYAMDTLFLSDVALGGYTCAQLFCGLKSQYVQLFGMHKEHKGPTALEDFVCDIGAPIFLRNDNLKMQETGYKWREVLCKYCIAEQTTEPHHLQQNPADRRIQDVKKVSQKIWIAPEPHHTYHGCTANCTLSIC